MKPTFSLTKKGKNLFSGQQYVLHCKCVIIVMMHIFRSASIIVEKPLSTNIFLSDFIDKIIFGSTISLVAN